MNIAEHVERGACEYPDRIALIFEEQAITYRECNEMSSKTANVFASTGLSMGDRIALFLPNTLTFVNTYLGVLKLGAIAVSINATLKREEVAYILADSGARAIVTTQDLLLQVPAGAVEYIYIVDAEFEAALQSADGNFPAKSMEPDSPAVIVYTSGTTGQPKGATLSHSNVVRNIEAKRHYLGIRPEDHGLLFMPLYHCFGQNAILNAFLQAGATVVLHRRFELERVMHSIFRDNVTMFFGVPTTFVLLLEKIQPYQMASVRYYFSAAAPLPLEIENEWKKKFGAPIFQGYGLTETSPFTSYNHLQKYRPGSIGTPIDGVEMKIVDPKTGKDSDYGDKGEIVVRGHNVMLGYWNRPEDTAKAIRDGWFHTGDIGTVDDEGYFFIQDRLTDMIVSGGVNVYPAEVENVLSSCPEILEAAVYGVAEPLLGEQVCADIVLKPQALTSEQDIRAFCRQRLSSVKVPTQIRFVTEIPKSPTGKILKRVLRENALADKKADNTGKYLTRQEASQWLHAWLRTNLDLPAGSHLNDRISFADLGMDSILSVRMANDLKDWSGCKIEVSAAWSFPTIEVMAEHIASHNRTYFQSDCDDIATLSDETVEALLLAELEKINR